MLATSLRELWRSSIWYLTTWDEKTFWIFPLKDILKKHSVIQRLHQITKKPFLNIRFSGLCSLAGFWADRASAEPFLSFPFPPLLCSCQSVSEQRKHSGEQNDLLLLWRWKTEVPHAKISLDIRLCTTKMHRRFYFFYQGQVRFCSYWSS